MRPERALDAIADLELEYEPGTRVVYSDLGFIVLGLLLERLTGKRLVELAQDEIFQPLELQTHFLQSRDGHANRNRRLRDGQCLRTRMSQDAGAADEADPKNWRQELIWGQVHDGNAYFLGGAAGHAGLFSTARETLVLANQFLAGQTKLLQPATCELFRQNLTPVWKKRGLSVGSWRKQKIPPPDRICRATVLAIPDLPARAAGSIRITNESLSC